jgi:hypothetical protein
MEFGREGGRDWCKQKPWIVVDRRTLEQQAKTWKSLLNKNQRERRINDTCGCGLNGKW